MFRSTPTVNRPYVALFPRTLTVGDIEGAVCPNGSASLPMGLRAVRTRAPCTHLVDSAAFVSAARTWVPDLLAPVGSESSPFGVGHEARCADKEMAHAGGYVWVQERQGADRRAPLPVG